MCRKCMSQSGECFLLGRSARQTGMASAPLLRAGRFRDRRPFAPFVPRRRCDNIRYFGQIFGKIFAAYVANIICYGPVFRAGGVLRGEIDEIMYVLFFSPVVASAAKIASRKPDRAENKRGNRQQTKKELSFSSFHPSLLIKFIHLGIACCTRYGRSMPFNDPSVPVYHHFQRKAISNVRYKTAHFFFITFFERRNSMTMIRAPPRRQNKHLTNKNTRRKL